jgi:1-acyl-sn-glycerol-3-phosphate acyltransferase
MEYEPNGRPTSRAIGSFMSPWALLLVMSIVLFLPRRLLGPANSNCYTNDAPEIHGILRVMEVLNTSYCRIWHRLSMDQRAPLPVTGPAILIANHTCGIDHLLLQATTRRVLGFMIAREYYDWPLINRICQWIGCIPVNRDGRDLSATRTALRVLNEGRVLPIFPEGHIVPASGRRLDELKSGCAYIAIRAQVPVVPAYICGTPETDDIMKALMIPSRARIVFGNPIDLSEFGRNQSGDRAALAEVTERFTMALTDLKARALSERDSVDF